jgi:predicted regulator of Ras-like GTPase activity (Roadblock/LC7/MglB family)
MIVDASDDIIVEAVVRHGREASTVAALAASLYRKARLSARAAGLGDTGVLRIEAQRGHIFAAGCGDLVLIALAESTVNMGLMRVEIRRAAEALA